MAPTWSMKSAKTLTQFRNQWSNGSRPGEFVPSEPPPRGKGSEDVPSLTPADNLKGEPEVSDKIVHEGKVDPDALAAIEQQGNAPVTAAAYFIAGKHEMEHDQFQQGPDLF